MTTKEIDTIYRTTPDYLTSDGFMTHGMSLSLWKEFQKHYEEIGAVSIDTQPKNVFSLLNLEYFVPLKKKH